MASVQDQDLPSDVHNLPSDDDLPADVPPDGGGDLPPDVVDAAGGQILAEQPQDCGLPLCARKWKCIPRLTRDGARVLLDLRSSLGAMKPTDKGMQVVPRAMR